MVDPSRALSSCFLVFADLKLYVLAVNGIANNLPKISSDTAGILMMADSSLLSCLIVTHFFLYFLNYLSLMLLDTLMGLPYFLSEVACLYSTR